MSGKAWIQKEEVEIDRIRETRRPWRNGSIVGHLYSERKFWRQALGQDTTSRRDIGSWTNRQLDLTQM